MRCSRSADFPQHSSTRETSKSGNKDKDVTLEEWNKAGSREDKELPSGNDGEAVPSSNALLENLDPKRRRLA